MADSKSSLFVISLISSISVSLSSSCICPIRSDLFIQNFETQCPISISPNYPLQVDGSYLDRELKNMRGKMYTSILFYASWCPFSRDARLTFEALGSMFPQIQHLLVEKTDVMPSIFSRYGIHSLPTILVVNQTSRIRFHGSKDIHSLVRFYQKVTVPDPGFEPVHYIDADQYASLASSETSIKPLWIGSSLNELIKREPYMLFSVLFIILRMFFALLPIMISKFKAFWALYAPQLNLEIFGEASQMLGRACNMINMNRIWAKLRFYKTRNFHEGAKNARVWASSLASVSLGEASSSRSIS